jgi:putative phage-type endonuclease
MNIILDFANILEDFNNTSYEDWQIKRKAQLGIGGSDAGILLGQSSFKDEYTLYLEKIGDLTPSEVGEAAEWGHTLEPVVANKWHERIGKNQGYEIEEFSYLLQSIEQPFMLANIDRLIRRGDDFGILEVKTASEYLNGEWENGEINYNGLGSGKVPPKYYTQLQHYFAVTGLEWGYFAALVGGNKLYSVYVERNEEFIQYLIETEALFTARLEMKIPPELNGSESCKQLLGRLYKEPDETVTEITDDTFGEWVEHRTYLKEQLDSLEQAHKEKTKPLEEELALVENEIKNTIAFDKGVTWQGWKVTWGVRAGRKSCDMKLLEEKYPEVAAEVLKQGESYRQLSIAKPKGKKASA